jgi:2-dehydro-3-deoxygluconokinase
MVELAPDGESGQFRQGFAGDCFNTATYLARAGLETHFLTRLGKDSFSKEIVALAQSEGIQKDLIECCAGRQPGLYIIKTDEEGERHFTYWRENSPAREMFDKPLTLPDFDVFYFSGITLAVTRSGIYNLKSLLQELRQRQCTIVFDPNYREALWDSREQAQRFYREVLPKCDIALPSLEDEEALWGTTTETRCQEMYAEFNLQELVIKGRELTTHVYSGDQHRVKQASAMQAVDTTGAGDAYNAGYLSARLTGRSIEDAIDSAQELAAKVIQQPGAILPNTNKTSAEGR